MKKLLILMLALLFVFGLTACGDDKKNDDNDEKETSSVASQVESDANSNVESAPVPDSNSNTLQNSSVEAYVKMSKSNATYQQMVESYLLSGISLDVFAEGNNLVYTCTYTIDIGAAAEATAQQTINATKDTLTAAADIVRTEAPYVNKVIYRYYSINGNLIASIEV